MIDDPHPLDTVWHVIRPVLVFASFVVIAYIGIMVLFMLLNWFPGINWVET